MMAVQKHCTTIEQLDSVCYINKNVCHIYTVLLPGLCLWMAARIKGPESSI